MDAHIAISRFRAKQIPRVVGEVLQGLGCHRVRRAYSALRLNATHTDLIPT